MGTLGYMSPEQLRGLPVDHRSDVFAFGAILYELLAGRKAFHRDTASDTISAVLRDEPPELADSDSPAVAAIVRHCLEKDRDRRFQSVRDIAFSLREQTAPPASSRSATMAAWPEAPKPERRRPAARAIAAAVVAALLVAAAVYFARRSSGPSGPTDLSIAVLPFVNMSADRNQEFFADGISEELLNLLTRVPQLRVIARTSSFSFKGKEVDVATIAKTLNVRFVLEGSVRESGTKMRVTAQLIRAADSSQMWSETYDRPIDDVLRVQDEIAAAVVGQLKLKLLGGTQPPKTVDPRAHALVVQARQLGRLGTKEGYDQSLALLREALAIQPDYALAWDNVAFYYMVQQYRGWMPQPEAFRLAREAVGKALAADPDLARAHARLGEIALDEGDLATAAKHVQHALTLAPTDDVALNIASTLLALLGRSGEAAAVGEYLVSKDPVNPIVLVNQSETLSEAGRYGEAAVLARTALGLTPGRASAQAALATALLLEGKPQEALAASADMKDEVTRLGFQAMAYHAAGKRRESDVAFRELMGKAGPDELWTVAQVAAFLGEPDQAFTFAEKASQIPGAVANASQDPLFGKLHDAPRWLPFLRKHGLAPEKLAAIPFKVTLPKEPS
jgi:TolB-like protein